MYIFISWDKIELFNQDVQSTDYFFKDVKFDHIKNLCISKKKKPT